VGAQSAERRAQSAKRKAWERGSVEAQSAERKAWERKAQSAKRRAQSVGAWERGSVERKMGEALKRWNIGALEKSRRQ
jgi:hypothetical protein